MNQVRALCLLIASLLPATALACGSARMLEGIVPIPKCDDSKGGACVSGTQAVYAAMEALEIPAVFTIGVQTSPWRMYDGEGRILTVEDMAAAVRAQRPDTDLRVRLVGSWTGKRPDGVGETLAQRLSKALDGFPVDGSDGFLWLSPKGEMRTTHQAYTAWKTGPYKVRAGDDVMVALVPGSLMQFEDRFAKEGLVDGVVQAGVGYDVFMLCPESALSTFEHAGDLGSAIGAYNAGLMHAEAGDNAAAITWLEKAAALGDKKATDALARLQKPQ